MFSVTATTDSSGVFSITGDFSMFKIIPIAFWNIRSDISYPYDIFVNNATDKTIQLRVRKTSDNTAVSNTTIPNVTVYVIGI